MEKKERLISKILDIIGEIVAVVLVLVWIVTLANAQWHFLDSVPVLLNILEIIKAWGGVVLMAVVGLEAMSKRNIVFRIIFLVLLAIVIIFLCFPGTYEYLIGLIPSTK